MEAGLVLAEPISEALLTGAIQSPEPEEILSPTTAEPAETANEDIAKASFEVAIATPTGAIQSPEPEEILSPTTAEPAETANEDIAKASSEVAIAAPPQESEQQPTSTRGKYLGDLAEFMGRKGLTVLQRMDPTYIARLYIEDHRKGGIQGKPAPQLPAPSNRLTRVARQAEKIRQGMEKEAARQAPPSVA